jgi:hypothetical protein
MEEAFAKEGRTLTHLIGPGVEHKYEPETLKELLRRIDEHVKAGSRPDTDEIHLQTRTLRYYAQKWIHLWAMEEHWRDARVDGRRDANGTWDLTTSNVAALSLFGYLKGGTRLTIDGQELELPKKLVDAWTLLRIDGVWRFPDDETYSRFANGGRRKLFGRCGPIDDAFMFRFLIVLPTGKSKNDQFQKWVDFESQHFLDRWEALMRGEARVKNDVDVTSEDLHAWQNLILWGDASSYRVIAHLQQHLPVKFARATWSFGGQSYDANRFAPVAIYPHPHRSATGYLVLNSGLTFREAHDSTNSNQNPKLPDWAIIDLSQPPDASAPGKIHAAGFFDERWQLPDAK